MDLVTGEQLALDCDPNWTTPPPPRIPRTPTAEDCRRHEYADSLDQGTGARPHRLRTAHTVPTGSYL
ncbi:hypothetical protein [Streptomyces bobili]|uniref:hypothetical protein n=1 Tax=Streptomyces bobili TaxID=67280 RepID=UPI0037AC18EF